MIRVGTDEQIEQKDARKIQKTLILDKDTYGKTLGPQWKI